MRASARACSIRTLLFCAQRSMLHSFLVAEQARSLIPQVPPTAHSACRSLRRPPSRAASVARAEAPTGGAGSEPGRAARAQALSFTASPAEPASLPDLRAEPLVTDAFWRDGGGFPHYMKVR